MIVIHRRKTFSSLKVTSICTRFDIKEHICLQFKILVTSHAKYLEPLSSTVLCGCSCCLFVPLVRNRNKNSRVLKFYFIKASSFKNHTHLCVIVKEDSQDNCLFSLSLTLWGQEACLCCVALLSFVVHMVWDSPALALPFTLLKFLNYFNLVMHICSHSSTHLKRAKNIKY